MLYTGRRSAGAQLYCRSTQNTPSRVGSRGNIGPFEGRTGGRERPLRRSPVVDIGTRHYPLSVHTILTSTGPLSCCPDSTTLRPSPACRAQTIHPLRPFMGIVLYITANKTTRKKYGRGATWGGCRFGARAPPSLLLLRPGTYSIDYCPLCYSIVFRCCTNPGSRSAMHTPPLCSSPHYFSASPCAVDLLPRSMI